MKDFRSYKSPNKIINDKKDFKPLLDDQYTNHDQLIFENEFYSEALFFRDVYKWMFISLAAIVVSGFVLSYVNFIDQVTQNIKVHMSFAFLVFLFFQVNIIKYFSKHVETIHKIKAKILFILFFLLYNPFLGFIIKIQSELQLYNIIQIFFCVAGTYGAMAIFGTIIKKPIKGKASILFMIIIGSIIASVTNIYMGKTNKDFFSSLIVIFLFALLNLDRQKNLLNLYDNIQESKDLGEKCIMLNILIFYGFFSALFFMCIVHKK